MICRAADQQAPVAAVIMKKFSSVEWTLMEKVSMLANFVGSNNIISLMLTLLFANVVTRISLVNVS